MTDKQYLKYVNSNKLYNFKDKKQYMNDHIIYMLSRTQSMFKWSGLPDTIPEKYLEQYLQANGFACIARADDDNLYAFFGGLGGEPDAYYNPTICVVTNPYLHFDKDLKIDEDCIIIRNDPFYYGLLPLLQRYGTQLAENDLSMWIASINTRIQSILTAGDDDTKEAAEKYLDDLMKGNIGAITENAFYDEDLKSIQLNGTTKTGALGDLVEFHQYLKASEYNELGLNANYNMKREALNSAESSINDDILFPLVDVMLKMRQEGAEKVNAMFGTNITVELASSWEDNKREEEAEIKALDPDNGETPEESEEEPEETPENDEGAEEKEEKDES